ncbi:cytochrome P450 [Tothia fuscella]|uniref:Cytochrome P450 n=1 Tax=Tothia fuscella TaxID=1048955 RepID=A0A9P4NYW0_9PEZI|nr:cytochrome P450 [Tothia fuscella]
MYSPKTIFLASIAGAVFLTRIVPQYAPFSSLFLTFFVLFISQFTTWFAWACVLWPKYFSPLNKLPQPKESSFLFGQFPKISRETNGAPMREWVSTIPNEGLIRYTHIFNADRVLITSPNALREVLVTKNYEFIKPPQFRTGLGQLLGIGVLLAEGEEHKRQRKLLMPAFAFRHIKDLYPTFWAKAHEVVEAMTQAISHPKSEDTDPAIVDVSNWASRVTLDIIGVAGMGHDFNAVQDPTSDLNQCYRDIFQPTRGGQILGLLGAFLPGWVIQNLPIKRTKQIQQARKIIRKVCFDLIAKKRVKLEKGESTDKDILSVSIQSGGFSDEDLVNQLMTFLAAGHETTASAMAWMAYTMCKYPEVQQRLREEIRGSLPSIGDAGSTVSSTEIDNLPYLHAVCNEIMRAYPSVPVTLRIAVEDATILGNFIPKGTSIILSPWAINSSKELWGEDAKEFNPDRWMGPGMANTGGAESAYSNLSFLHGPRSCIGKDFAKAEFACLVAAWVGRFDMHFADEGYVLDIAGGITVKPKGLKVRMKAVEGW